MYDTRGVELGLLPPDHPQPAAPPAAPPALVPPAAQPAAPPEVPPEAPLQAPPPALPSAPDSIQLPQLPTPLTGQVCLISPWLDLIHSISLYLLSSHLLLLVSRCVLTHIILLVCLP